MKIEFKKRLVIKGDKGQELNRRETKLINEGMLERFLPYVVVPKKENYILEYETIGKAPLSKLLKTSVLSKRMFLILLDNLYEALKEAERNVLSRQLIMMDADYVIVEPSTWHVYLMYVPLQFYETKGNLMKLLLDVVKLSSFDQEEDTSYVEEYLHILDAGAALSILSLENYINRLKAEVDGTNTEKSLRCPKCKAKVQKDETVCPTCGYALQKQKEEKKEVPSWIRDDRIKYAKEMEERRTVKVTPWIENVVTREKILLNEFPFRIGKGGDLQYTIPNNLISRNHVEIVYERGCYYAVDLNSSNGTFLNGRRLQCGFKEEMTEGAFLRLADIEFVFHKE